MSSQVAYICSLLAVGFVMGTVFDIYNTVTGVSKWFRWLRPVLDLTFWVVSAGVVFYVVFLTDDGRMRLYVFGLLAIGYGVYRVTLHHRVVGSAFVIMRIVDRILRAVFQAIYSVTVRPLSLLWRLAAAVARAVYRLLCVIESWAFAVLGFWMRILLIRWLVRLPIVQRWIARIHGLWEEMWALASKWLKNKLERV